MATNSSSTQPLANVSRFLDEMAAKQGGKAALRVPRGRDRGGEIDYLELSFLQLGQEQDSWARHLRSRGIKTGSRVLLLARPGLPLIAICFALFKLGAVPIVIDPGMGLRSFLSCVRRSQPDALVGISLGVWISRLFATSFNSLRARVAIGGRLSRAPKAEDQGPLERAMTASSDLAAILFTSGSTGPAKGVRYEHGMFEAQVAAIKKHYGIETGEVDLPMLPVFALFNPALGMTTVVPEINPSKPSTVDPAKIVQAINQCSVTNSFGSPTLWAKIGAYCEEKGETLPTLKRILMAGASVPPGLMREFKSILKKGHTFAPYGATEILPVSSIGDDEVLAETAALTEQGRGTCVGATLPGVEARILPISEQSLEADALDNALPQGEVGEIVVTGPSVTRAYDRLPEASRNAKIVAGDRVWHRMGDLGYTDASGRLWFCGRLAERVESEEGRYLTDCCEGVFNAVPSVQRSALVGLQRGGRTIPAMAIQPIEGAFPKTSAERNQFIARLREAGSTSRTTRDIQEFVFEKSFPVDVRHNAKINRIELACRLNRS